MIEAPTVIWQGWDYLALAAAASLILLALLVVGYARAARGTLTTGMRFVAAGLKTVAILLLAACLLEPLYSGKRARPGANKFALLADNSQSMMLKDDAQRQTRGEQLKATADK